MDFKLLPYTYTLANPQNLDYSKHILKDEGGSIKIPPSRFSENKEGIPVSFL
jgi:hypothetical protein